MLHPSPARTTDPLFAMNTTATTPNKRYRFTDEEHTHLLKYSPVCASIHCAHTLSNLGTLVLTALILCCTDEVLSGGCMLAERLPRFEVGRILLFYDKDTNGRPHPHPSPHQGPTMHCWSQRQRCSQTAWLRSPQTTVTTISVEASDVLSAAPDPVYCFSLSNHFVEN